MRAPRYNVAIRGDARTIKALFARGSQLTWGERGERKKERERALGSTLTARYTTLYTNGDGNEDESKPFR